MSTQTTDTRILDRLKKAALELARTKAELAATLAAQTEPIAIVGMGCRFGGGIDSPADLWQVVLDGTDVVGPFPTDRGWPDLDIATDRGAFLDDAAGFDADFFGIGPNEATAMDPQQRHVLEVAWNALEDAQIDPRGLRGTNTSVYLGATSFHYGGDYLDAPAHLGGQLVTGNVTSVLSGRISYLLGLAGPAVTLDTACSSALYAVDSAMSSLRRGESTLALAGGVCVMSTPGVFSEFAIQGALAPDGRCKSFGAGADGTGWGEGVGIVVLERLSDAVRNGHPIAAVVRGSAVNCDGASNGLTAPNGAAQQSVIRSALAGAGLSTLDVDAVEAHGTGTALGDPIEAAAVLATYGAQRRPDAPLWLGSVKSNIGHTQAAAGIGSLIKAAYMVDRGVLPRTLHASQPSPVVDWTAGAVQLLGESRAWPDVDRPRRVGVSGFGVSGTNVHLIIEQAPPRDTDVMSQTSAGSTVAGSTADRVVPLVISARSAGALQAVADRLADRLETGGPDADLAAVARSLIASRTLHEERAVVVAADRHNAIADLRAGVTARRAIVDPRPVFVYPGQGSQWMGMGRMLIKQSQVFADRFAECDRAIREHADISIYDGCDGARGVDVVQPTLFAMMVSLTTLYAAHGVTPSAVIGHSQGEIVAAVVAGALTLSEGARIVTARSRALLPACGHGGMAAVAAPGAVVETLIAQHAPELEIAGRNGPLSIVVSGPVEQLHALAAAATEVGVRTWIIDVDYASHSGQMDRLRDDIARGIGSIAPQSSSVPFISTVTGAVASTTELTTEYWCDNLRRPVLLQQAVQTAHARGHRVFIEVSPHPVLGVALLSTLESQAVGGGGVVLDTLHRDEGDLADWLRALAGCRCAGVDVDWTPVLPELADGAIAPHVALPHYPFQHRTFWYSPTRTGGRGDDVPIGSPTAVVGPDNSATVRAEVLRLEPALGRRKVATLVLSALADALGHTGSADLAADRSFLDLGVGSLAAVALRTRLTTGTGVALSVTVAFEYPNPTALAAHIYDEIVSSAEPLEGSAAQDSPAAPPTTRPSPVVDDPTDLDTVTDDEMFAALDRELGLP